MKERLFKPLHWIMLFLISVDFIDTSYRLDFDIREKLNQFKKKYKDILL